MGRFQWANYHQCLFYFYDRDGDIASLEVDAIVNSTNESMNDINPASVSIFRRAGPRLGEEIKADIKGNSNFIKMLKDNFSD